MRANTRAQRLVALDDGAERALQGRHVEGPRSGARLHVVDGLPGLELIQEPQALLRERHRIRPRAPGLPDRLVARDGGKLRA